jgi:hypothetical protein
MESFNAAACGDGQFASKSPGQNGLMVELKSREAAVSTAGGKRGGTVS